MRAFISINLTDRLHQSIEVMQRRLDGSTKGVRWTQPQNCHLTLKFLGDVSESMENEIVNALNDVGPAFDPFHLELGGVGQFPPRGPLSVLWVGVSKGEDVLCALERSIHKVLIEADISFDKKKFSPHLTIGRARRGEKPFVRFDKSSSEYDIGTLEVKEFCLMKSDLQQSGPIYTVRKRFCLGNR